MKVQACLIFFALEFALGFPALAQPAQSGFGRSGSIPGSLGESEAYGVDAPVRGERGVLTEEELFTRHRRFGQSTGIGASTAQTTATTIEDFPAASGNTITAGPAVKSPAELEAAFFQGRERGLRFSQSITAPQSLQSPFGSPAFARIPKPGVEPSELYPAAVRGLKPFSFVESGMSSLSGLGRGASILTNP